MYAAYLFCFAHFGFGIFYNVPYSVESGFVNDFCTSIMHIITWPISQLNWNAPPLVLRSIKLILKIEGVNCAVFATSMEYLFFCIVFSARDILKHLQYSVSTGVTFNKVGILNDFR